ncbi:MAG: hypothetical protein SFW66_01480 [Gammaproteobacteria bacterium]|nr:hypothetical protein [Gammaproteobacteria bacterium]
MISPHKMKTENEFALAQYVGEVMRGHLSWMQLQPQKILETGCQSGEMLSALQERYPFAQMIPEQHIVLDSADLIMANLTLAWSNDSLHTLQKWRKQLRPNGLLMLTTFGLDTLTELPDRAMILPKLVDMHNVGDALVHAGFSDPVLEVEYVTLTYRSLEKLCYEMRATQMILPEIQTLQLTTNDENIYSLTFEIIYAHAFASEHYAADEMGEARIPISQIKRI